MIKVNKLNKYFNKRKKNEIHVLNDVSLDFPEKGLVVLLGSSGSGKTTLLNVIGGLDKVEKGSIVVGDKQFSKYNAKKWDHIRNQQIGYIFQNYNLLKDLSVFDNLAFVLNMIGINDKDEVEKRVNYVLNAVNMYKFRKRKASELSGGQQQRVAIARAIVKNPSIVIADEPTGNLDSKNTLEVMNIIKQISQNKLVVLVTHERNIANFYGDRIIEIKDGKVVSDYENKSQEDHGLSGDDAIYLKDMQQIQKSSKDNVNFSVYADDEKDLSNLDVKFIIKNNTIYIDLNSNLQKVKVIGVDNAMVVKDEHFEQKTRQDMIETSFDLDYLKNDGLDKKVKSTISFKKAVKLASSKVANAGNKSKLMMFAFGISGVLIAVASAMLFGALNVSVKDFMQKPESFITVEFETNMQNYSSFSDYESLKDLDENLQIITAPSYFKLLISQPKHIKSLASINSSNSYNTNNVIQFSSFLSDTSSLKNYSILNGRLPKNDLEFVLDKKFFDVGFADASLQKMGVWKYEDFGKLNINFKYDVVSQSTGELTTKYLTYKAVGVVDTGVNTAYFTQTGLNFYYNTQLDSVSMSLSSLQEGLQTSHVNISQVMPLNMASYVFGDDFEFTHGTKPVGKQVSLNKEFFKGVLENIHLFDTIAINDDYLNSISFPYTLKSNTWDVDFVVSGLYESDVLTSQLIVEDSFVPYINFSKLITNKNGSVGYRNGTNIELSTSNKNAIMEKLTQDNILFIDNQKQAQELAKESVKMALLTSVVPIIVLVSITAVGFYFLMRASLMSRIYELSVYRALGVVKKDIYKSFLIEILFITSVTALIGFVGGSYFISAVSKALGGIMSGMGSLFAVNIWSVLSGLVVVYGLNILIGLLPVYMLLTKTPSQILSKYDI